MKKESLSGLVITLIIIQIFLVLGFFGLSSKVEDMYFTIKNMEGNINNKIESIESEITNSIEEQATLIESVEIDFGKLDKKNLTVPVTYTIIPKESSEETILSLQFDEETLEMERNMSRFTLTVDTDVFAYEIYPNIIISEDGKIKTEQNEKLAIYSVKYFVFPDVYMENYDVSSRRGNKVRFSGQIGYQEKYYDIPNAVNLTEARIVIEVDNAVISEKSIDIKDLDGYKVEEEISLKDDQNYKIYVIAKDELNLEHHFIMESYSNNQQGVVQVDDINQVYGGLVYSQDGEQLWPPESY